jgi:hypothetical protein
MYYVEQSASFEAVAETGLTGLVGTISIEIIDNIGNLVDGPSVANIIEYPAGSGVYQAVRTAPAAIGQYAIVWSTDGTFSEKSTIVDDLTVVAVGSSNALPPITPIDPDTGPELGPCNQWTTNDDIAACCNVTLESSDLSIFEEVNSAATRTLWELSGRRYAGQCDRTVRPCGANICGFQVLSRGHIIAPWSTSLWGSGLWDGYFWGGRPCGCMPLSRVHLSGYPVREIVTVKIDGIVVDPSTYRLDEWRWLTRLDGAKWPNCQRLDRDDTEDGTFSVRYTYGQNPPEAYRPFARGCIPRCLRSERSHEATGRLVP